MHIDTLKRFLMNLEKQQWSDELKIKQQGRSALLFRLFFVQK